jgi:hypothetical protein
MSKELKRFLVIAENPVTKTQLNEIAKMSIVKNVKCDMPTNCYTVYFVNGDIAELRVLNQ